VATPDQGRDAEDGPRLPFKVAWFECWFADRAAYQRAAASQAWARLEQDAATLFDVEAMANGMSAVLDERVIRDHES
jgi:hypothetical protein